MRADRPLFLLAVLALLGGALYLPAILRAEFLNFDDPFFFGPQDQGFVAGGLWGALTGIHANAYLPVAHVSLWLDRSLFGLQPLGPHLHSLLLHVVAAYLLLRLLRQLGLAPRTALAAAVLFLVHPALAESVAWVSGRKDLLSGIFTVLCLEQVLHTRGAHSRRPLILATLFAILALYSKATALVLPLWAGALLWLAPRSGVDAGAEGPRPRFQVLVPLLMVTLIAGWHHRSIASGEGTLLAGGDLVQRLTQVPGAYLHYLGTAVWPFDLDVLYPEVAILEQFRAALVPGFVAILLTIAAIAVAYGLRRPRIALGLAGFVLALAPFNTALPASSIAAADRYLYLAIPGLVLALAALPRVGEWLCWALAAVFAVLVVSRSQDFRDSERLWTASLARDEANAVAHMNLAAHRIQEEFGSLVLDPQRRQQVMADVGQHLARAFAVARYPEHRYRAARSLRDHALLRADYPVALGHAGQVLSALEELPVTEATRSLEVLALLDASRVAVLAESDARAQDYMRRAAALAPDDPRVLARQASRLLLDSRDDAGRIPADAESVGRARQLLDRAEAAAPVDYDVQIARAELESALGKVLRAEKHLGAALAIDPSRPEAHIQRASLFLGAGMAPAAEEAARLGLAHCRDPRLQYLLGVALSAQGETDRAIALIEDYLEERPGDRDIQRVLATLLGAGLDRELYTLAPEEVGRRADRILELAPGDGRACLAKAVAARGQRQFQAALVWLEKARDGGLRQDPEWNQLWAESQRDRGYQLWLGGRREPALTHFQEFLRHAPAGVPTDAVRTLLREEWKRLLARGQQSLLDGAYEPAERDLRRALDLRPEDDSPRLQLGMVLLQRGGAEGLGEALSCFERAERGSRAMDGGDPSLARLYRVLCLARMERRDEARALAEEYLADPPAQASPGDLERLRAAAESLR